MDLKEAKNQIPFIMENGIVYNIKDIQKVVKDLGHVHYFDYTNESLNGDGDGYILSVVANNHSASIIASKRMYLNVNGFEYLKITTADNTVSFDLVDGDHILRLIPINDTIPEEFQRTMNSALEFYDEEFDEYDEKEETGWLEDDNEESGY